MAEGGRGGFDADAWWWVPDGGKEDSPESKGCEGGSKEVDTGARWRREG